MEKTSVIIALGAGLECHAASDPPRAWIGQQTRARAEAAARLWKQQPNSLVIFSGGRSSKDAPSEAEAMKDYVLQSPWNIPENLVFTENESMETAGNIRNTVQLLRIHNVATNSVTLIAGRRHRCRAARYCKAYGIRVTAKTAGEILGTKPEYVSTRDRMHEIILTLLQMIDPKGYLPSWIKRWQRKIR